MSDLKIPTPEMLKFKEMKKDSHMGHVVTAMGEGRSRGNIQYNKLTKPKIYLWQTVKIVSEKNMKKTT